MTQDVSTQVLVIGGGPVGLTLAMDLAQRGIQVLVAELRHRGEAPPVKCNHISARSMEVYRRLGVADTLRDNGLPPDYPHDVAYRTSFTGTELSRIRIPSRAERRDTSVQGPDTGWPTPEPPHRINQIYIEPILFAHAQSMQNLRIICRTQVTRFEQDETGVTAWADDLDGGEPLRIRCDYLVGCDGGRSMVRKAIGATFTGVDTVARVQSTLIDAPDLLKHIAVKPAWATFSVNPRRSGNVYAIDGQRRWLVHNYLRTEEPGFDAVDRDWAIRPDPGRGRAVPLRRCVQRRLDRPPAGGRPFPRPARVHLRRCRAFVGAHGRLRHERRHCRRHEPVVATGRAPAGLGRRGRAGRLPGRAPAHHRAGVAVRHEPFPGAAGAARGNSRQHRGRRRRWRRGAPEFPARPCTT